MTRKKLAQSRRILQQVTAPDSAESLRKYIEGLEGQMHDERGAESADRRSDRCQYHEAAGASLVMANEVHDFRAVMRWILAALYVTAGVAHFAAPSRPSGFPTHGRSFSLPVLRIRRLHRARKPAGSPLGRYCDGSVCHLRLACEFQTCH